MPNSKLITFLSTIIILTGIIVMYGWIADIPVLKSIFPNWVTMKFATALCFFCSGFILIFIQWYLKGKITLALAFLPLFCLIIFLVMNTILISSIFNIKTGIESLFIKEDLSALFSSFPGRPSIGTIVNFFLISIAGILTLLQLRQIQFLLKLIGSVILLIGLVALLGYALNVPALYFYIESKSTAMAFHTSILFSIAGANMILMNRKRIVL